MMAFLRERNAERAVQPATDPGQIPIWFRLLALPSSWYGFIGLAVCTYLVHPRWQGWIGSFFLYACLTKIKLFASYGLACRGIADPWGFGGSKALQSAALRSATLNPLAAGVK
jgi:hypothetical protein